MFSKFRYTLVYADHQVLSFFPMLSFQFRVSEASIRSSAHPDFTSNVQVSLNFAQDRALYMLYNPDIYPTTSYYYKESRDLHSIHDAFYHTSSAISLEKRQSNGRPFDPLSFCSPQSHSSQLLPANKDHPCPLFHLLQHSLCIFIPIHTYTYALTDKHTVTC